MERVPDVERTVFVRKIRTRVALVVFGMLALFLFSSEFVNAVFNNRLDEI